jgi:hypothetical protein
MPIEAKANNTDDMYYIHKLGKAFSRPAMTEINSNTRKGRTKETVVQPIRSVNGRKKVLNYRI